MVVRLPRHLLRSVVDELPGVLVGKAVDHLQDARNAYRNLQRRAFATHV